MTRTLVVTMLLSGCASLPARVEGSSWGSAMAEVGRRFELVGRALAAGRYELASYELDEIDEVFHDTLPHASLPKEGHPERIEPLRVVFADQGFSDLARALRTKNATQAQAGFAATATSCNACHQASGHGFIEVPSVAGERVPKVDGP